MKLLTDELLRQFSEQGDTSNKEAKDIKVIAKFFNPCGAGTWFAVEYDPEDRIFFGYVNLGNDDFAELGYYSLDELENLEVSGTLKIIGKSFETKIFIERDLYFGEHTLDEVIQKKGHL